MSTFNESNKIQAMLLDAAEFNGWMTMDLASQKLTLASVR